MSTGKPSQAAKSLPIHPLSIADAFDGLTPKEKLYSHYLARAAWSGTRIILCQVSPEANSIFDFIMEIARSCQEQFSGIWNELAAALKVPEADMESFLLLGKVSIKYRQLLRNNPVSLRLSRSSRPTGFGRSEIPTRHAQEVFRSDCPRFRSSNSSLPEHRTADVLASTDQFRLPHRTDPKCLLSR